MKRASKQDHRTSTSVHPRPWMSRGPLHISPIVACCCAGCALGFNFTDIGAVAASTASAYQVSLATVGLFTTALAASHAAMQLPGGRFVDRFGAGLVGGAAMAWVTACNVLLMATPSPILALVVRAALGIGTGFGFVALTDLIRSSNGSALSQGMFGGLGYGATALALAIVPQLVGIVAWRAPYVLSATTAGLSLLLLVLAVPRSDRAARTTARASQRAAQNEVPTDAPARKPIYLDPGLYRLGIVHGIGLTSLAAGVWISTLFVRGYGLSVTVAGVLGAIAIGAGVISRPLAGLVINRSPTLVRPMLTASLIAGAAGVLLLATASSVFLGALGGTLFGFAAGAFFAPAMFAAGRLRADQPATAVAFINMLGNGAVVIATALLGLGFTGMSSGRVGFIALAGVWTLALAAIPHRRDLMLPTPAAETAAVVTVAPIEATVPRSGGHGI